MTAVGVNLGDRPGIKYQPLQGFLRFFVKFDIIIGQFLQSRVIPILNFLKKSLQLRLPDFFNFIEGCREIFGALVHQIIPG